MGTGLSPCLPDKQLAEMMTTVFIKSNNPGHGKQWKKDVLLQRFLKAKQAVIPVILPLACLQPAYWLLILAEKCSKTKHRYQEHYKKQLICPIKMNTRFEYIDNMKGIGIILVVIGHCLAPISIPRVTISSFHMPLFFSQQGIASYLNGIRFLQIS